MDLKEVNKIFIEGEIRKISDAGVQDFMFAAIKDFPEYFWTVPASRSKYHYPDERQDGGLVLHVRRLCKLTDDVVRMYRLNLWEKDVLIAASILHDSFSRGIPPNVKNASDPMHPYYPEMMFPYNAYADRYIKDHRIYEEIMTCVASHMGQWSPIKSAVSNKKLPTIFHMMDYIASRDYIKVEL